VAAVQGGRRDGRHGGARAKYGTSVYMSTWDCGRCRSGDSGFLNAGRSDTSPLFPFSGGSQSLRVLIGRFISRVSLPTIRSACRHALFLLMPTICYAVSLVVYLLVWSRYCVTSHANGMAVSGNLFVACYVDCAADQALLPTQLSENKNPHPHPLQRTIPKAYTSTPGPSSRPAGKEE
jgi:hypothetical protein